jgi:diguanylate cyclase
VTNRNRRQVGGSLAWALPFAALVFVAGAAAVGLQARPDRVVAVLLVLAVVAATCALVLEWRLRRARSDAMRDPLTGLPNRVLLDDRIEQALRRSMRNDEPFTLIVIDLDGFKDVNDVRGHGAGDAVLKSLGRRFEAIVRASDTVARVGGDEFVVLSLGTGDDEQAAILAGRLRGALRRPFVYESSPIEIDGSVGWAVFPEDGATAQELLERADGQMYATKRDTSDDALLVRRGIDVETVRDVEDALQKNELVVLYQPILDLRTGEPRAAEALVRRVLPGGSLAPPAEFMPHVERTPLVRDLTFVVVAEALRSAELWASAGHELSVSVNVPYRLFDDPRLEEGLGSILAESLVSPQRLTLEVVPAGRGAGSELDEEALRRLKQLGVRISLDDGGRAASFAALRVLPLDELKIDVGFVEGLARHPTDAALVHGIIDIGHALGLAVVAEGVETRDAWDVLAHWGCDYAQGFYVAPPRPAKDVLEWLRVSWPAVA